MKYTVVLFDPLRIEYTEQVRKAFDELRSPEPVTVTAVNDLLESGSIMYSTNPEVGERYKNLEQDFLRIKVYDPRGNECKIYGKCILGQVEHIEALPEAT